MCFRLLAGVQGPPEWDGPALERLAFSCGLDLRQSARGPTRFLEIAWGDCACSLYTRREGRERAIRFVDALLAGRCAVQLLLLSDDGGWEDGPPLAVATEVFRAQALAALPEGRVAELH
jgi:hypothetical protein